MTRNYIFNLETLKIELHFEKSEYQSMSDAQKAKIKSAFLWSNARGAWVSRCKEPNLWNAKRIARELGFDGEERTGERLTFAEQLDRKAERAEARADRMDQYAANAQKRGVSVWELMNYVSRRAFPGTEKYNRLILELDRMVEEEENLIVIADFTE